MRVLYISEVQWLSQISRKHQMVCRFPDDWATLFLSPANATTKENSFVVRSDESLPHVRYRSLPLPKPDSTIPVVRALTPALGSVGYRAVLSSARGFRPDIVVCSYIWAAPIIPDLKRLGFPVVYDCNDLHPQFYPSCPETAEGMFRAAVGAVNEVIASSERLRAVCGRGVVVGNGVDLTIFGGRIEAPLPEKIATSALSRCTDLVAYVGSVDERIDFAVLEELLRALAADHPDVGVICVGRVFARAEARVAELTAKYPRRVLFTGRVPYENLPSYLSHASVGIAPFVLNDKTAAINPNKLYMYAAMDQNIVSTPFSEDVREYADLIYLASGPKAFASDVKQALGDDERRRAVRERIATPNSWDEKAKAFRTVLVRVASSRGSVD
ncbi:MAG: glycosyltransferase [Candidatus Eisenbacteria bacterium]|nr:glycosyltransferase [Candidatus Eisenbacteria bacterium]